MFTGGRSARLGLLRNLPKLFDGAHIRHPLASRRAAARIEFDLKKPVDVMVDGEVLTLECRIARSASGRAGRDGMNGESEHPIPAPATAEAAGEQGLRRAWAIARSTFHWLLTAAFFFPVCSFLILLGIFVDPRRNDGAQRMALPRDDEARGRKLVVRRAPGFDPARTCFLLVNHVNLFDPFVLYATIPQFFRGLELESHFRIPVYGWMMKRFGNVPVPDDNRPSDLKRMWRLTRAALDSGVSLAVFPEGQRTITGRVGPFKDGVFRMALQFGTPIVPVSIVGSFEFNKKTSWLIRPGTVTVYLHDVIETKDLRKEDFPALRDRIHAIIAAPIEEAAASAAKSQERSLEFVFRIENWSTRTRAAISARSRSATPNSRVLLHSSISPASILFLSQRAVESWTASPAFNGNRCTSPGSAAIVCSVNSTALTRIAQSFSKISRILNNSVKLICFSRCLRAMTDCISAKVSTDVNNSWSGAISSSDEGITPHFLLEIAFNERGSVKIKH